MLPGLTFSMLIFIKSPHTYTKIHLLCLGLMTKRNYKEMPCGRQIIHAYSITKRTYEYLLDKMFFFHLDRKCRAMSPTHGKSCQFCLFQDLRAGNQVHRFCLMPSSIHGNVTFMQMEHKTSRFYPLTVEGKKSLKINKMFFLLIKTRFNKYFQSLKKIMFHSSWAPGFWFLAKIESF